MPGCTRAAVLTLLLCAGSARAELATGPCAGIMDPNNGPISDPRLDHLVVDGVHVNVLRPPGYHRGYRHYPVVYLFHGAFGDEDSFSTQTDLLAFTASLDEDDQALVVMPDGGHLPAGRDWADGTHPQESYVIGTLLPYIDRHYRTVADRAHRATAGFSAGGLDAMVFAARHPDLFSAAGSFSGFVDPFDPNGIGVVQLFAGLDDELCGATEDWTSPWGDPVAHPMGWEGHDPVELASNLQGISLYIDSGNGIPCPGDPDDSFLEFAEATVYEMGASFDAALTAAGIPHTTAFRSCGLHLFANADIGLRNFWPQMLRAFGRPAPRELDYRTVDASAAVSGWSFTADPARAPELLDVRDASARGLTVTGSGSLTVTTPARFERGEWIAIEGARNDSRQARADSDGRLSFTVDLGPAHTLEQDTPAEQAAAASPGYFVTRAIQFQRGGCR